MNAALSNRIAEDFAAADRQPRAGGPSPERRRRAIETLTASGLPTAREENWKYANLRSLEKVRFAPVAAGSEPTAVQLPPSIGRYARYTFIDGVFSPALSAPAEQHGVRIDSLQPVREWHDSGPSQPQSTRNADLRFALLNEAFATDGVAIHVAAEGSLPTCIELVFVATADGSAAASYPRVDVQVATGAHAGLIERHISAGSDANFVNAAVNVDIARGASLQHYRLQQMAARALWFDTLAATLAEDARYQLFGVNLGALVARSTAHVRLAGARSEVALLNVAVGGKNQVHDSFALVEHIAPQARTDQYFRGISSGRARVAFNGKIIVRKEAQGTDSRQSLRGLLAGANAEIDVRPQLEIYTDDVRCSHGATAGKLDDNMLFYLLSRGLDRETAQRLLKWAFLEDVVARIAVPELRRQIEASLAGQLNESALKELL